MTPISVAFVAQADAAEGTEEVVQATQPVVQRFFDDWYGDSILGVLVALFVLNYLRKLAKRAGEVSKYGDGLDRDIRVQIKQAENEANFAQAGDILFANEAYTEAAELYAKVEDWIRAGESLERAGNVGKAAQYFKKGDAPAMAAQAFARKKQWQAAAREYLAAEAIDKAAECFAKAKDFKRAAELFRKSDRLHEAGEAYDRLGDRRGAAEVYVADFERQYEMARGDVKQIRDACELAAKAAEYMAEDGQGLEAADLLAKAGFKRRAAELYTDIGQVDRAAEIYLEANRPMHAAKLYESVGDTKKAMRHRAEAKLIDDDQRGAADDYAAAGEYMRAAELYNDIGDFEKAAEMYESAGDVRMAADLYGVVGDKVRAAQAYEKAGDFGQAMQLYREAGDYKAELQAAKAGNNFHRVGQILLEHGRKEDALAAFQRMDASNSHYEEANLVQGDILRELGRLDVAFAKYKAAIGNATPGKGNVDILFKMARVAEEADVPVQALQLYESVIGVDYYYRDASERAAKLRKELTVAGGVRPMLGGLSVGIAGGTVAGYSASTVATAPSAAPGTAPAQDAGLAAQPAEKKANRYEIIDEIARGGMGIVFKAKDRILDRIVAYKILSSNLKTNKVAVKYFLREAQAAAKMSHPNIVTVFDAGEQDGEYYMAMEYVEGQTLKALFNRQGAFPEKLIRYIMVHACRGLQYAHDRGLVHRDIKPGNMMLTRDRTLKIMDFGLAKFVEEVQAKHTRAIGTPYYMSPEQIVGNELDGRTDIYSLGVSMFECATGQVPFAKGDLSYHHLHTEPPKVHELNDKISKELSAIILRCMSKKADGRFPSASDLLSAAK